MVEMQASDFDEVAREALILHAKNRGLNVSVSPENIISFGVGDLACQCYFVKGSDRMGQVEFTVWIDSERKIAYTDQCTWLGNNIIESIAGAVHNWCAGQLPVWLAVFQGKGVDGLLTTAKISSFDDATKQGYAWQMYIGIGQSLGTCPSVVDRVKETPPYKLILGELMQLQMTGYFKERPGIHCIKLFYGRTDEILAESRIDGDHWDGANAAMHNFQWTAESGGTFHVKQFMVMVPPPDTEDGGASPTLAPQVNNTMVPNRPKTVTLRNAHPGNPPTVAAHGTASMSPTAEKASPIVRIAMIGLIVLGAMGFLIAAVAFFVVFLPGQH